MVSFGSPNWVKRSSSPSESKKICFLKKKLDIPNEDPALYSTFWTKIKTGEAHFIKYPVLHHIKYSNQRVCHYYSTETMISKKAYKVDFYIPLLLLLSSVVSNAYKKAFHRRAPAQKRFLAPQ